MTGRTPGAIVAGFSILLGAQALANDIPPSWRGEWRGAADARGVVQLNVDEASKMWLQVENNRIEVTSHQISPDRRTVLMFWENGEGALVKSDDGSVVASIFDKRFPLKMVVLRRSG